MVVQNGLGRKLSDVFNYHEDPHREARIPQNELEFSAYTSEQIAKAKFKAHKEWFGAIAAIEKLLLNCIDPLQVEQALCHGLILSAPAPILSHTALISQFQTGIFMPSAAHTPALMPCQHSNSQKSLDREITDSISELPLLPNDPIAREQFCLVMTPRFGLLVVLGEDNTGLPGLQFSFDPETILQAWSILRSRLLLTKHHQLYQLDSAIEHFTPRTPDYRLVTEFSRLLLKHLPELPTLETKKTRTVETVKEKSGKVFPFTNRKIKPQTSSSDRTTTTNAPDVELLQALTHEIRTPLTTIRTMTRLVLKRSKELTPEVVKRLEAIDRECTEQINRMELIFRAAELETTSLPQKQVQLIPTSLEQVLQQSIPQWQKQAQRRNVELDVVLPKKLPQVVSDPAMLDQMLTGLMEKFTRSLPVGGQIRVQVSTAGSQLKLQFYTQSVAQDNALKALGQLLMFQPETGSLSLNMDVTKNLFNVLGGKLIVRQRPQQGEVLTIFLPLGSDR
jgi:signal transduction histidine kinase